jgi:hypothetical protein
MTVGGRIVTSNDSNCKRQEMSVLTNVNTSVRSSFSDDVSPRRTRCKHTHANPHMGKMQEARRKNARVGPSPAGKKRQEPLKRLCLQHQHSKHTTTTVVTLCRMCPGMCAQRCTIESIQDLLDPATRSNTTKVQLARWPKIELLVQTATLPLRA